MAGEFTTDMGVLAGIQELNNRFEWYHGDVEPVNPRPFMNWAHLSEDLWKQRNAENTEWIIRGKLSEAYFGFALLKDIYTKTESDDLFAPKAGDSEQQFSIAAATMLAHALNLGQFMGSIQTNGFIIIPIWDTVTNNKKNYLIQWGTANWQGLTPIQFPTAFQSAVFGVFLTQKNGAAITRSQAKNITLNDFVLDSDNEATIVSFLAIGI
jgi:hypothetical protein